MAQTVESIINLEQDTDPITAPAGSVGDYEENAFTFESLLPPNLEKVMAAKHEAAAEPIKTKPLPEEELTDEEEIKRQEQLEKILGEGKEGTDGEEEIDSETPYWEDFDEYKKLKTELQGYGYNTEAINKVIEQVVERKGIENNEVLKNLNDQILEKEQRLRDQQLAIDRANGVEKNLYFDNSEYAQANYHIPGNKLRNEVSQALTLEGAEEAFQDVMQAKNKTQALAALKDYELDQDTLTVVLEKWKQYTVLKDQYDADKKEAQQNLGNALKTNLPKQVRDNIFTEVIQGLNNDPEFEDLSEAIKSQDKEYLNGVVGVAKSNFESILDALSDPTRAVTDKEWLRHVAGVFVDASHKTEAFNKYEELKFKHRETESTVKLLVSELKRLRAGNEGISRKGRSPVMGVPVNTNGKDNSEKPVDINVEKAKKIFKGDFDLDEILERLEK